MVGVLASQATVTTHSAPRVDAAAMSHLLVNHLVCPAVVNGEGAEYSASLPRATSILVRRGIMVAAANAAGSAG